jgi:adenosylcobinamide-phosphate synthase
VTHATFPLLALLLDRLLGEPRRSHPLVGFGRLADRVERALRPSGDAGATTLIWRGGLGVALLVVPPTLLAIGLTGLPLLGAIASIVLLYLAIGAQSLAEHAHAVADALDADDIALARQRVGMIVSRETDSLDATAVARATVESVLENGADAIFSALFWFMLAGAPGAVLYRLANTLDAMWGYRNARYLHFGRVAARLDDLLNYLPARLTAFTYLCCGNFAVGLDCWRTQAPGWYSPNAGPVMAAGAGALGLELGGAAIYHGQLKPRPTLGVGRAPQAADIRRAVALVRCGMWSWAVIALAVGGLFGGFHA